MRLAAVAVTKPKISPLVVAVWTVAALLIGAAAQAQISSEQVRSRYERQTKGGDIDDFVRKLENDDPEQRLDAVRSLGETNDSKAVEYLIQALGDSDMRIKAKSIDALGDLRANEATPVLIQQLFLRQEQESVKRRILASLGKIGDPSASQPIIEFLQRDLDRDTRGTAIYALGEIGGADSLEALATMEKAEDNATLQRLAREAAAKVRYHQRVLASEANGPQDAFPKPKDEPQP